MGDALVESVGGRPVVFVAAGDVGFTLGHSLDYANQVSPPTPTVRGANFSAVYAIDGLTGKRLWRFDTEGEAMPTPVYHDGSLFFNTGDGHLYAVDASTGQEESVFTNPKLGFSSMSSANYYITPSGQFYVIYGTQDPNFGSSAGDNMVAVNETDPTMPSLAWDYNVVKGINTGLGDVPVVVDQQRGLVLTDALVNTGTSASPQINIAVLAVNAETGALVWKQLAGGGRPVSRRWRSRAACR
jgi:outer membrane protein assembly factor BamB